MKKSFKIFCVVLCLMLAATLISSVLFISEAHNHNCSGDGCLICFCIGLCKSFLNGLNAVAAVYFCFAVIGLTSVIYFARIILKNDNPIRLKVKLLN